MSKPTRHNDCARDCEQADDQRERSLCFAMETIQAAGLSRAPQSAGNVFLQAHELRASKHDEDGANDQPRPAVAVIRSAGCSESEQGCSGQARSQDEAKRALVRQDRAP